MSKEHKAGIVVPYRDREYHLEIFIPKIVEILKFRNINYQIYIVEQEAGKPFNTGMLKNIGTIFSIIDGCDYIVFNDVDTIPTSYDIFYDYPGEKVNHLFGYTMSLGGALSLSVEIVERINGFYNNFWGWGFEDTDLKFKIEMCGIMIDETDSVFSNIDIDENKPTNERKFLWLNNCDTHIRTSLSDGVTNEDDKRRNAYYREKNKQLYALNQQNYLRTRTFHDGLSTTAFKVNFKKDCGEYTLINVSI